MIKTIGNIQNLLKYLKSQNAISNDFMILINGKFVKTLKRNTKNLLEINNLCVKILVYNNSLLNFNINKNTLSDFINIVPLGSLELVMKQNNGYAYIKS